MIKKKKQGNPVIRTENLLFLYKGNSGLKKTAEFGPGEMQIEVCCAVEKNSGTGIVSVSIAHPHKVAMVAEQFFGINSCSSKPINDILLFYRVMRTLEALPVFLDKVSLGMVFQGCITWGNLSKEAKEEVCGTARINIEIFEELMKLVPPNFEETLSDLRKKGFTVSLETIQEDVAAGRMEFSPFLEAIGVKSPDEFKKESERIKAVVARNLEYVQEFIEDIRMEQYKTGNPFVQKTERYMRKAAAQGIEEDDLIVGFGLFEANYQILEQSMEESAKRLVSDPLGICTKLESDFPGMRVIAVPHPDIVRVLREAEESIEKEFRDSISVFLANRFPGKGRSPLQYQEEIDKIRNLEDM